MTDIWQTVLAVLASLGGGGLIVAALASWLGKVWAERLMIRERAEHAQDLERLRADLTARNAEEIARIKSDLDLTKSKLLGAHQDKVGLYRMAIDLVAPMIVAAQAIVSAKATQPTEVNTLLMQFETQRLRSYGYLAMFAPQPVMDAFDGLVDYLLDVLDEKVPYEFTRIRTSGLDLINAIRRDLGVDTSSISYRGTRR